MTNQKIISIHIPKTAGTSFRLILEQVYGKKNIQTFYDKTKRVYDIPERVQLIHGHIEPKELQKIIAFNPSWKEAKVIVWLRDPVERLFSNYHYLKSVIEAYLQKAHAEKNLGPRMIKSLEDYYQTPNECNRMQRFFNLNELTESKKLLFVGRCEHFHSDLKILANILEWKNYKSFHENKTSNKPVLTDELREKIRQHNLTDIKWYEEVLNWRDNNQNGLNIN